MIDTYDNKQTFFTSINKCVQQMKINQNHLRTLIFSGRMFNKRYAFRNFKLRDQIETEDNQQRSYS